MRHTCRPSALVPPGFAVEGAVLDGGAVTTVRGTDATSVCPGCGVVSQQVRSRHRRRLADLLDAGRPVRLELIARRFRCVAVLCGRRIFSERFDPDVLAPSARRTSRLECLVHHLELALSGRSAAAMAQRLMLLTSNDTFVRAIRRRGKAPFTPPNVIGIDEWTWRCNQCYDAFINNFGDASQLPCCQIERRQLPRPG